MADTPHSDSIPSVWKEALQAIRHNFLPGLVLWLVAAAVGGAYYLVPSTQGAFATVAQWKATGGLWYSLVATALFAGVIPFVVLWLLPQSRATATVSTFWFLVVFWGYRGCEIDVFYRFQGFLFGNAVAFSSVAPKVLVDLFVYNVVWAAGFQLLAYHWKNHGFRLSAFRGFDWRGFVTRQIPVALVSTWVVWFPVVTLVYSLPPDLQIPLFNFASCFWSLVMATLTTRKRS